MQRQLEADRQRMAQQQHLAPATLSNGTGVHATHAQPHETATLDASASNDAPPPPPDDGEDGLEQHTLNLNITPPAVATSAQPVAAQPTQPTTAQTSQTQPVTAAANGSVPANGNANNTSGTIFLDPGVLLHDDAPPPPPEEDDDAAPSSYFGSGGMDEDDDPPPPPEEDFPASSSAPVNAASSSSTAIDISQLSSSPGTFNSAQSSPHLYGHGTPPSPHTIHGAHFGSATLSNSAPTNGSPLSAATSSSSSSYSGIPQRSHSASDLYMEEGGGAMRPDDVTTFVPIVQPKKDYSAQNSIKDKVVDDLVFFSRNFQIIVKGGTLVKLIEKLSGESTTDNDYIDTFLLTYRTFISPTDLLEQLLERYKTGSAEISSEGVSEIEATNTEKKQKLIRIRVGNVLKRWLSDHYHDYHDPALLARLEQGIEEIQETQVQATLRKTIQEQQLQKNKIRDLMFSKEKPVPILPKGPTFDDWDVVEVARQLCLHEQTIYQAIHPKEALNQAWNKHKERAPNIIKMISFFNRISKWVSTQVCLREDFKARVKLIIKFMQLSMQLRQYNNFDCMQAVLSGLNNSSVWRMKLSWTKIEKKDKFFAQWKTMSSVITDTTNNFNAYRTAVTHADPPIIPYLGVYLTDLTFTEDGNADYLRVQDGRGDIINFEKMRRVAVVIKDICTYQQTPYNFERVPMIYDFFAGDLPFEDDQALYGRSRILEPPLPPGSSLTPKKSSKKLSFTRRVSLGMFSKDKGDSDSEPGSPSSSSASPKGDKKKDKEKKSFFK